MAVKTIRPKAVEAKADTRQFKPIELETLTVHHIGSAQAALVCKVSRSTIVVAARKGELQAFVVKPDKYQKRSTERRAFYFLKTHLKEWMDRVGLNGHTASVNPGAIPKLLQRIDANQMRTHEILARLEEAIEALRKLWS